MSEAKPQGGFPSRDGDNGSSNGPVGGSSNSSKRDKPMKPPQRGGVMKRIISDFIGTPSPNSSTTN
ncbi:hypothetical protein COLO4_33784 [Corchorus olitorius]|uniref:Uncharacterized protein n=1 Tax=Corchorus olitorius TaxID=93759 RepID=A0A1R3GR87_9ROSI|nr:hypothetical protein COLO4_33784 [Corchorus olitorius]